MSFNEPAHPATPSPGIFPGDTGTLPMETRRALAQLLRGPSIDGRHQQHLWQVLARDEHILRSRLHELFLEIVIDRDQQVAFTRQVRAEDADLPILLRSVSLTAIESLLLLFLRQVLTEAEAHQERAVVSEQELAEHLATYEPANNRDHAKFAKRIRAAVEKAKRLNILQKIRRSDDRLEISPTLKLLYSAEEIIAVGESYKRLQATGRLSMEDVDANDEEEGA